MSAGAKAIGDELEATIVDEIPALEAVDDSDADWHDARLADPLTHAADVQLFERWVVPAGRPVEVKAARVRVSNGTGTTKGRFYVKRAAHQKLVDARGLYLLLVYDEPLDIQARVAIPAYAFGSLLAGWSDVSASWGDAEVSKLAWSRVIDPNRIKGDGGGR